MASANLNSPDEKQLEAWLRQSDRCTIADNGFTARVLAELPPSGKVRHAGFSPRWTRRLAIAIGAGAGAAIGWTRGLGELFTLATLERVGAVLHEPSLVVALTITAVTLAALYVPALRRLWT